MKKKLVSFILCLTFIMSIFSTSFAKTQIIEKAEIKIVIDGKMGKYSSPPILVEGRTLLPLRELLVNLGVQNDNDHIIWNGSEQSVTVKKDSIQLYLKVSSKDATVNNEHVALDAAPVNYNSKVYIPARFVAESFGKKVGWNGTTKTVFINSKEQFEYNKQLLGASINAMQSVERLNVTYTFTDDTRDSNQKILYSNISKSTDLLDNKNKLLSFDTEIIGTGVLGDSKSSYIGVLANGLAYSKDSDQKWSKKSIDKSIFDGTFDYYDVTKIINASDDLCSGLLTYNTTDSNLIVLQGDFYPININTFKEKRNVNFTKMNTQIVLNRNNNYIEQIVLDCIYEVDGLVIENGVVFKYSDINGDIKISIPVV